MKFYDVLTKNTIRDEINRICGTTDEVYSLRDKLARVDEALNEYWALASDSAPEGTFDDTGNSSVPIETQNIVEGTNAYKISDFTNEVLQILKVTVLDGDGIEHELIREEFDDLHEFNYHYSTDSDKRGIPSYWAILGDYIYLRACPDYSEASGLRVYANRELSKFTPVVFTTTNAGNQIDATAHGLSNGDVVIFMTDNTLPNGYSTDTAYYVINSASDSFQVATAGSGSTVTISDDGTGTHKFIHLSKAPGIVSIHHKYLARKASLDFLIEKKLPHATSVAALIAGDEQKIQEYWQNRDRRLRTIIQPMRRRFR